MKSQAKTRLLLALVLLLASGFPALNRVALALMRGTTQQRTAAPPPPRGIERVTSVEGITEYRFANGFRVLLFPDPSQADDHGQHHLSRRLGARRTTARPAWRTCSSTWCSRARRSTRTSRRN